MITLQNSRVCYLGGDSFVPADNISTDLLASKGIRKADAGLTMAASILAAHDTAGGGDVLKIRFDKLTSHDITYVSIIQTARASGLESFPMPYVLTNCHNSLCAVGGTINEDDHMFGLSAARKYGGIYVPPHLAVIHQYAREMLAGCGRMILGSDSHTRYGALGTMGVGEGGPELVKQLLGQTYDIRRPEVIAVHLTGQVRHGVGPQDVALAIIGAVFEKGFVKNKVMEFVGSGIASMSADFRIGVDVMTTETTCLSSIWETDENVRRFYQQHGHEDDYAPLHPAAGAVYDGLIELDLSAVKPMIAMPFHPSNVYTIEDVLASPADILEEVERRAAVSFGDDTAFSLKDKLRDGRIFTDQGIIGGCAGGGFENLCAAADILSGASCGSGPFSLSVYPASMPVYMELVRNGCAEKLIEAGAVLKTAFCGPCFGAGDTPANNAFSIRHSTRNFPNREGLKVQIGQIASVALMDARSIAATAANGGILTPATDLDKDYGVYEYHFDKGIYDRRVFDAWGRPEPEAKLQLGPNIRDWPKFQPLPEYLIVKVTAMIHDPVTTTDELIPSGETSSYRSNPEGLAEFALSRKAPDYVGLSKEVRAAEYALTDGACMGDVLPELRPVMHMLKPLYEDMTVHPVKDADGNIIKPGNTGVGSAVFARKPGDGSAREQAASCQKVLGGWANIAFEYATKRYRSNLINWGILPFVIEEKDLVFDKLDYLFFPGIRTAVAEHQDEITGYAVKESGLVPFTVRLGDMTEEERQILLDGCLINYNGRKSSI